MTAEGGSTRHDLQQVGTRAELAGWSDRAGTPRDPWIRWCLPATLPAPAVVCHDVALVPREGRYRGFWVRPLASTSRITEQDRMRHALRALANLLPCGEERRVSLPQPYAAAAHEVLPNLTPGGDWEWMWTTTTPPATRRNELRPNELRLVELDDRDDAGELIAFTREHNPRVWAQVGTGTLVHWIGLRNALGELVAIGGAQREASGVAHLAGILTHREKTRRGLGAHVTRALTTWALADGGASTLGVFSDSPGAVRLYARLGYRTAAVWHSVSVRQPL